ncbi:MAG TPA: protein kinase [Polyangia bacterium]|jgi:hypothetical protein|nr:protein kinase [Polyangia bacterium]
MKVCPNCHTNYPDDGNFCPQEACATAEGPRRLTVVPERFEQSSRIGGTRSGEIWRAKDTQSGEDVAYKIVAPEVFPSPAGVERAMRELKQLTRAQNPHVARVIDFGKTGDGRLFVATELLTGQPLDQLVQQNGPFPLERAKQIAAQIGEALLEGQKVGVIHHDLAAKNVLVGDGDVVKVINFATPRPLTETVFGVPQYLSPEQAEGKLVDQRSNTYSLGAILMLMLTGEPPVTGADDMAVLENVLKGEVIPPSRRRAGIGPEVDRVVMKALEKSSSRRPLTMRQFLTDIGGLSASSGEPGAAAGHQQPNFAKTMMFTGGSAPEVRKLVAEAIAARAEANGSGPTVGFSAPAATATPATADPSKLTPPPAVTAGNAPASAPDAAASQLTPPPQAVVEALQAPAGRRGHGAAVAATMVALPAQSGAGPLPGSSGAAPRLDANLPLTPPPAARPEAAAAAPKGGGGGGGKGANFRETLWFKKGDVEQMVAEAKAKAAASGKAAAPAATGNDAGPASEPELPLVDEGKPLEDRYIDDGTLTVEDRKKFSLRSGGTATAMPVVGKVPGERMSESEMLDEIGGSKRIIIIGIAVAVVVALIAVLAVAFKGKSPEKSVEALTPVNKPTEPVKPAEPPSAPAAAAATAPAAPALAKEHAAPSPPVIKEPSAPRPRAVAAASKKKPSSKKKQAAAAAAPSGKKQRH